MPPLVSTAWLAERIDAPDIRIADASWYLPQAGRDAKAEYVSAHIPRAVFFDIDELSDETSPLPHMLAPGPKFASRMRKLGLGDGNLIVVYDGAGIYSSPRAWWMLRAMGHNDVVVLDGGLPKWRREGRAVENMTAPSYQRHFTPRPNNALVRDLSQMRNLLKTHAAQIVDARGAARFAGKEAEPRAGVRPGHIPTSLNVPYTELTNADGTLKSPDDLKSVFATHRVDLGKPTVTTCGSGVTAAIEMLALTVAGADDVALYDGSWAQWGRATRQWRRAEMTQTMTPSKRRIPMTVTFLQMAARPSALPPPQPKIRTAILKAANPPVHFYRYLYDTIGDAYHWVDRRKLSDEALGALIAGPAVELYVLYADGCPAGMAELDFRDAATGQIAYFGLMPEAVGKRLGYFFLYHAVVNAWAKPISKLLINTCTLDHPRALPLYQRIGFVPVSREDRYIELP